MINPTTQSFDADSGFAEEQRISKLCFDNTQNRPSLACKSPDSIRDIKVPCFVSLKYDGIRARVLRDEYQNPRVYSRSGELIPNEYVQQLFAREEYLNFDGELIVGPPNAPDVYHTTESYVMSVDGEPAVRFYVFDYYALQAAYTDRLTKIMNRYERLHKDGLMQHVQIVTQELIQTHEGLEAFEQRALQQGYEGAITRSLAGLYKHGRSTLNEGYLVKIKRFKSSEAEILGFIEQLHNDNELTESALGLAKRSSAMEGMVKTGQLGALLVRDVSTGVEFKIGSGFTTELRIQIWNNQSYFRSFIVKYKYFPIGNKDKPRQPIFVGWRHLSDMSKG